MLPSQAASPPAPPKGGEPRLTAAPTEMLRILRKFLYRAQVPARAILRHSAQIFALQLAHHLHIARLAAFVAPGQQIRIARRQILLTDARVARMPV